MLLDKVTHHRHRSHGNRQKEHEHIRNTNDFKQAVRHVGFVERIRAAGKARDIPDNHRAVAIQKFLPTFTFGINKGKLSLF